jgi:hypothetical protein
VAKPKSTDYQKQVREFRSKVALLKRKGLVSKKIDARKASITDKTLLKKTMQYDRVIRGVEKVTKVKKSAAKKLKAEGAEVKRIDNKYRVVTDRNFTVNSKTGSISPRYGKLVKSGKALTLPELEQEIRELGAKLNTERGDAMALQIFGNDTATYQDADVMIQDLHQYEARNPALKKYPGAVRLIEIKGTQLEKRNVLVQEKREKIQEGKKKRDAEKRAEKRAAYKALAEKRERQEKTKASKTKVSKTTSKKSNASTTAPRRRK